MLVAHSILISHFGFISFSRLYIIVSNRFELDIHIDRNEEAKHSYAYTSRHT